MLHDRLNWHYDPAAGWHDPEAAGALLRPQSLVLPPSGYATTGPLAAATYRYDVTDHAEFQRPDPQWHPPPGLRGMIVRVCDGVYREPVFSTHFRLMDGMLQRGELDYCGWYVLPNPNVSIQRHLDAIAGQLRESGVTWGRPGHLISIDDEPTPWHGQYTGQDMRDLRNALQDTYQREELHYVGLYNGNYGFISGEGWKLWAPWPTSNGALPSWTTNLVMQQWGVAGPGEVPGFPNANVDVNKVWDWATLDALSGRDGQPPQEDELTMAQYDEIMTAIAGVQSFLVNAESTRNAQHGEVQSFMAAADRDLTQLLQDHLAQAKVRDDQHTEVMAAISALTPGDGGQVDGEALAQRVVEALRRSPLAPT